MLLFHAACFPRRAARQAFFLPAAFCPLFANTGNFRQKIYANVKVLSGAVQHTKGICMTAAFLAALLPHTSTERPNAKSGFKVPRCFCEKPALTKKHACESRGNEKFTLSALICRLKTDTPSLSIA
ncbi:hypothetical protein [Martelella mangrovi]|uniref:Secreted protein n=1 Tax=Martelella mangrovi TaxID=1397477 RepID=A0ABV2I9K8_9HYPH